MRPLQRYSFLFFFFSSLLLSAQSYDSLLKRFVTNKSFSGAKISILAVDLSSSDTLMSFNPQLPTATASTTKLFSTAMALELLGPEYRFETTLFTDGLIDKGVLKGNLWIKGGGDVSFGSKFFNGEGKEFEEIDAWIDSLKKLGIHEIQGKVIVDGSDFDEFKARFGETLVTGFAHIDGYPLIDKIQSFEYANNSPWKATMDFAAVAHPYSPLFSLSLGNK